MFWRCKEIWIKLLKRHNHLNKYTNGTTFALSLMDGNENGTNPEISWPQCLRLFGYAIIWSAVVDTWLKWRHDDDNSQQTLVWEWKISGVIPVVS